MNWGTATVIGVFAGMLYGGSKEASASVVSSYCVWSLSDDTLLLNHSREKWRFLVFAFIPILRKKIDLYQHYEVVVCFRMECDSVDIGAIFNALHILLHQ